MERSGNLDILRLIAAYCVLWSHQHALTKTPEAVLPFAGTGELGVYVFFAISGYLNVQSIVRGKSTIRFLLSRFLRIYPALICCVVFCIAIGALVTSAPMQEFWGRGLARNEPLSFFLRNSTLFFGLDYELPGVFKQNPYPGAINGSLWTLPYEVKYYVGLAVVALCCAFRVNVLAVLSLTTLGALMLCGMFADLTPLWADKYGTKLLLVFIGGTALGCLELWIGRQRALIFVSALIAAIAVQGNAATAILLIIAPLCLIMKAIPLPQWTAPRIDISYGVYLYAFPIQQLFATTQIGWWGQLICAAVVTTGLACLSAVMIERPALNFRRAATLPVTTVSRAA